MGTLSRTLLLVALLTSSALADDKCEKFSVAREKNPTWTFVEVQGADMDRFVANFNALEPVTNHHPTKVWVAYAKDEGSVFVSMLNGDCVTFQDEMPAEAFFKMLLDETKNPV